MPIDPSTLNLGYNGEPFANMNSADSIDPAYEGTPYQGEEPIPVIRIDLSEEIGTGWTDPFDVDLTPNINIEIAETVGTDWRDSFLATLYTEYTAAFGENVDDLWFDQFSHALINHLAASFTESVDDDWLDQIRTSIADWGQRDPAKAGFLILIEIQKQDGSWEHVAGVGVRHPSWFYYPRVSKYGTIDRSIPLPVGVPRISDVTFSLINTDGRYSQLFAPKTMRKKSVRIFMGPPGGGRSAFFSVLRGEITNVTYDPGICNVTVHDYTFDKFLEEVPGLINKGNFPNLPDATTEDFANIILGTVKAAPLDWPGVIRCPLVDTVVNGYLYSRHPSLIDSDFKVLRHLPDQPAEEAPTLVPTSEYTMNQDWPLNGAFAVMIQFHTPQEDGTEISAVGKGFYDRFDEWKTLYPGGASGLLLNNPSDAILALLRFIVGYSKDADHFNLQSFSDVRDKCTAMNWTCDGVWDSGLTYSDALAQLLKSFDIDLYIDKYGRVAINLTTDVPSVIPEFDDRLDVNLGSMRMSLAEPTYNQVRYKYNYNYVLGKWITESTAKNDADLEIQGDPVEDDPLEMNFVRNATVALEIATRHLTWISLDAHRCTFRTPAPRNFPDVELTQFMGVTHFHGITESPSGWVRERFKISDVRFDLDGEELEVSGIRYVALKLTQARIDGYLGTQCRSGPHFAGGNFYGIFSTSDRRKIDAWMSGDAGQTWSKMDTANAPSFQADVGSFDSFFVPSTCEIHVATQEVPGGKVEYHIYNIISAKWTKTHELVVSAVTYTLTQAAIAAVSIEVRSQSKTPVIMYNDGEETVWYTGFVPPASINLGRIALGYYQGGTWHTMAVTTNGENDRDYLVGRAIASAKDDQVWLVYSSNNVLHEPLPHFLWITAMWQREHRNVLTPGNILGGEVVTLTGSLIYYPAWHHRWGGPAAWVDPDNPAESFVTIPFKAFGGAPACYTIAEHAVIDPLRTRMFYLGVGTVQEDSLAGARHHCPGMDMCVDGGRVYFVWSIKDSVIGGSWEAVKYCEGNGDKAYTEFDTWSPADGVNSNRCSEYIPSSLADTMAAQITAFTWLGSKYLAKFTWDGDHVLFELMNVTTDIPRQPLV